MVLNIGVIGAGVMGMNHIRVLSQIKGIDLYVSDTDKSKLESLEGLYNIKKSYSNHMYMINDNKLDGVIIAVPSQFHRKITEDCMDKELNILLEKPIAGTIEDAQFLKVLADNYHKIFTVGHIERFNPVVIKIKEFIVSGKLGDIYVINTCRAGPFPKRLYGAPGGVLVDLAVHDIDLILNITGQEVLDIHSKVIKTGVQDIYSRSILTLKNNIICSCEFSWISPKKERSIEIFGTKGVLTADYITQELNFYENSGDDKTALSKGNVAEGVMFKYPIPKQEPLKLELEHFIDCIKNNKQPQVSAGDAFLAFMIVNSIQNNVVWR